MKNLICLVTLASSLVLPPGGGSYAFAEDPETHPIVTCHRGTCAYFRDLVAAADPTSLLQPVVASGAPMGTLLLSGSAGRGQGSSYSLFRCEKEGDGSLKESSCELVGRSFELGKPATVPSGFYEVVYSGGQTKDLVEVPAGEMSEVKLKQLPVPTTFRPGMGFRERNYVVVTRDMTSAVEQGKVSVGIYGLADNLEAVKDCPATSRLSLENARACEVFSRNNGYPSLLNGVIRFDIRADSYSVRNLSDNNWTNIAYEPVGGGLLQFDDPPFVSVFPGVYDVVYSSDQLPSGQSSYSEQMKISVE